jgi:uncharacterized membrane protein YgcG
VLAVLALCSTFALLQVDAVSASSPAVQVQTIQDARSDSDSTTDSNSDPTFANDTTDSYDVDLDLKADGTLFVTEVIVQNFAEPRHGIERLIPLTKDLGNFRRQKYEIVDVRVVGSEGTPTDVTNTESDGDEPIRTIRIGDPNRTITGRHRYRLTYRVQGVGVRFNGENAGDELYWDAIGTRWEHPITNPSVHVHFPWAITRTKCFAGPAGSTDSCTNGDPAKPSASTADVSFSHRSLNAYEGMTVVVGAAKGSLTVAPKIVKIDTPLTKDIKARGPAVVFFLGGWALIRRRTRFGGVDLAFNGLPLEASRGEAGTKSTKRIKRRANRVGPVEFGPPEGLPPALVSSIAKQDQHNEQFSSTLVDLATRGYLTIAIDYDKDDNKTWRLTKATPNSSVHEAKELFPFEQQLLNALFRKRKTVLVSDLEEKFGGSYRNFLEKVEKETKARNWYAGGNVGQMGWLAVLAFVLVFFVPFGFAFGAAAYPALDDLSIGPCILASWVLAGIALRRGVRSAKSYRTSAGSAMYSRVEGFRKFLVAGEHRMEHAEKAQLFIDFLPYAIALGIVDDWSKRFSDLGELPDMDWYQGESAFEPTDFGRQVNNFARQSIESLSASTPSRSSSSSSSSDYGDDRSSGSSSGFSSSGSSGGGSGGGGGGSW